MGMAEREGFEPRDLSDLVRYARTIGLGPGRVTPLLCYSK